MFKTEKPFPWYRCCFQIRIDFATVTDPRFKKKKKKVKNYKDLTSGNQFLSNGMRLDAGVRQRNEQKKKWNLCGKIPDYETKSDNPSHSTWFFQLFTLVKEQENISSRNSTEE